MILIDPKAVEKCKNIGKLKITKLDKTIDLAMGTPVSDYTGSNTQNMSSVFASRISNLDAILENAYDYEEEERGQLPPEDSQVMLERTVLLAHSSPAQHYLVSSTSKNQE
jgi:hypothetical protein